MIRLILLAIALTLISCAPMHVRNYCQPDFVVRHPRTHKLYCYRVVRRPTYNALFLCPCPPKAK